MGRRIAVCLGLAMFLCALGAPGLAEEPRVTQEWSRHGRAVAASFMAELRTELLAALEAGGPIAAIEVCRGKAREIAQRRSRESGFRVGRTSLRVRNPRNAPDAWEARVLETFQDRAAAGEPVAGLDYFEVVEQEGKRVFRQLLAIPMGEPCLKCHGESLAPEVQAVVQARYPDDRAVGFRVGEVRGAFTLSRDLE